ncbi:uncharacterized protein LOC125262780 [Megalobrama amblycephala]|uniref:uncharacterized protein LOC125262780 n=1 Tax=Megalobrama amblycephala TaxID=75352 RepID=UPI0020142386|nr:uncharacterized protein LOC125262780 [Megalobrama amblycephala]
MKKMFLKLVLLCLWRLDGVFGAEEKIVFVGDSVTLNFGLTELKDDDVIRWSFKDTLIAEINKRADRFTVYDNVGDGRFRDRLKLDNQTGSLTITNITMKHDGDYHQGINYRSDYFRLFVTVSVKEGDSVTLNAEIKVYLIQWRFGDTLIALIDKWVNRFTVYDDVLDGRFRDRLKLDNQTGSLTITNTTMKHAGEYELWIKHMRLDVSLAVIVSVTEGDSVTLNAEIKVYLIQWRFGDTLIAVIIKEDDIFTVYDDVLDGRFRDRLKLDNQTGSLTITNITMKHDGVYELWADTLSRRSYIRLIVYGELNISFTCFIYYS